MNERELNLMETPEDMRRRGVASLEASLRRATNKYNNSGGDKKEWARRTIVSIQYCISILQDIDS